MKRLYSAVLLASSLWAGVCGAVTVDGRTLRMDGGAFVAEDADWLAARARHLLAERDYGRANDIATLLAAAAPPALKLEAAALAARTKYFAVGHKEGYIAFRDLYRAEKARRDASGAPATEEDAARLAAISREAIGAAGATYGPGAAQGPRKISAYDSPTANTGIADPQPTRIDLRWSVNLLFLVKEHDAASYADGKAAVKTVIDDPRTFTAYFKDTSSPKSNQARALDDVRGSVFTRGRKMLPAAIAREIQNTYNLEGFKFCVQKPVGIPELTTYAARVMAINDKEEVTVERYEDAGYTAYRAVATVRAKAETSLADVLRYFGADPYVWRPFVGNLEAAATGAENEEGPPAEPPAGGIPDD